MVYRKHNLKDVTVQEGIVTISLAGATVDSGGAHPWYQTVEMTVEAALHLALKIVVQADGN